MPRRLLGLLAVFAVVFFLQSGAQLRTARRLARQILEESSRTLGVAASALGEDEQGQAASPPPPTSPGSTCAIAVLDASRDLAQAAGVPTCSVNSKKVRAC